MYRSSKCLLNKVNDSGVDKWREQKGKFKIPGLHWANCTRKVCLSLGPLVTACLEDQGYRYLVQVIGCMVRNLETVREVDAYCEGWMIDVPVYSILMTVRGDGRSWTEKPSHDLVCGNGRWKRWFIGQECAAWQCRCLMLGDTETGAAGLLQVWLAAMSSSHGISKRM